jgi:DNA-binding NarL/FixJ family response regulator
MPITLLVADDKEAVLRAVRVLLRQDPEIHIVGQAGNYQQTTQSVLDLKPQVVVMDLHMSDESSISRQEVKSVLHTSGSGLIAMSFWNDKDTQAVAKNLGAVTLLDKLRLVTDLIPAIRAATVNHTSPHHL